MASLLIAAGARAGVQVPRTIPFAPSAGASPKVQQECQVQTQMPAAIQQFGSDVQLVDQPSKGGRSLELSIIEMHAPGGDPSPARSGWQSRASSTTAAS